MTLALFAVGKTARIVHGDAAVVLRQLADNSVDAVVTDPPAGIKFMGREWDSDKGGRAQWVAWLAGILAECLRVLKPGGHAFVWALPKRSHWTAWSVEDAGFEICDVHHHIFGQGRPNSRHALKAAVEHWILGRKPFTGTVAANVAEHGTGSLQIDACRLETQGKPFGNGTARSGGILGDSTPRGRWEPEPGDGRWPAHLSLDEVAAAHLDAQSGETGCHSSSDKTERTRPTKTRDFALDQGQLYNDRGGASRFFYVAKASENDKTEGGAVENDHETVKSTELMRWLVRLITPPGGTVLDCFAGSGTTAAACAAEGLSFIGIEQKAEHFETARARLERHFGAVETRLP